MVMLNATGIASTMSPTASWLVGSDPTKTEAIPVHTAPTNDISISSPKNRRRFPETSVRNRCHSWTKCFPYSVIHAAKRIRSAVNDTHRGDSQLRPTRTGPSTRLTTKYNTIIVAARITEFRVFAEAGVCVADFLGSKVLFSTADSPAFLTESQPCGLPFAERASRVRLMFNHRRVHHHQPTR